MSAHQLADVLNYLLGLPRRSKNKCVVQVAILPFVVMTWEPKRHRPSVEQWCDGQLAALGLVPGPPLRRGRRNSLPMRMTEVLRNFGARI